ncbi:MAG: ribosome-associated translation inhibitor RaiA [Candidatus Latescibacteria bacterium]|nr:ribosome-associated translation inhibitor RaiA [Candidatus Latescibacterota bacterium]
MQITIKGRHWKVTPDYREYAERRIEKLQRYFAHLIRAQLTVTEEGYRHLAELRIVGNGVDLRGRAQDPDPRVALDSVLEKQEQALKRRKDRLKDKKKRGETLRREAIPPLAAASSRKERGGIRVVRTKAAQRTLTVDQAIRALLKGRHPILAFSEADSGGLKVAYRMDDGQVGLLELD